MPSPIGLECSCNTLRRDTRPHPRRRLSSGALPRTSPLYVGPDFIIRKLRCNSLPRPRQSLVPSALRKTGIRYDGPSTGLLVQSSFALQSYPNYNRISRKQEARGVLLAIQIFSAYACNPGSSKPPIRTRFFDDVSKDLWNERAAKYQRRAREVRFLGI